MTADCGTITVIEPFDSAAVNTVGCSNLPSEVSPGAEITVSTTVKNANSNASATATVVLNEDNTKFMSKDVTISPNSSTSVSFTFDAPTAEGDYNFQTEVLSASKA